MPDLPDSRPPPQTPSGLIKAERPAPPTNTTTLLLQPHHQAMHAALHTPKYSTRDAVVSIYRREIDKGRHLKGR
ncbi:hypothetical protein Pcinc_018882 [Petrolisthes cinctipes]|uniref:Uncharacterized protein n=1 Tax=Petrolisthes cinctipes TaxID=88211 RepID=A0AAE1KM83_PETCI|nr:hypothetical protein Pcinc_018882 [Petrolisthes cinctipes]